MTITPELRAAYNYRRINPVKDWRGVRPAWSLPIGEHAKDALRLARADLKEGRKRYTSSPWKRSAPNHGQLFNGKCQWIEKPDHYGLRLVGFADEIDRHIEHTGWFADAFQDESYRGVVYQLPARKGLAQFVGGYADPINDDAALIDWGTLTIPDAVAERESARRDIGKRHWQPRFENASEWIEAATEQAKKDAARLADSVAERHAESEREYQTAWQAGSAWAQEREEIESSRATIKALLAERRIVRDDMKRNGIPKSEFPALCETIRRAVSTALADIAESRRNMEKLKSGDYHEFVFYPSERLRAAFNDGADESVL